MIKGCLTWLPPSESPLNGACVNTRHLSQRVLQVECSFCIHCVEGNFRRSEKILVFLRVLPSPPPFSLSSAQFSVSPFLSSFSWVILASYWKVNYFILYMSWFSVIYDIFYFYIHFSYFSTIVESRLYEQLNHFGLLSWSSLFISMYQHLSVSSLFVSLFSLLVFGPDRIILQ